MLQMLTEYRLLKLLSEVKMVGRIFNSALTHPANYPEIHDIEELNGISGLIVACDIQYKQSYLFHESQMYRIISY